MTIIYPKKNTRSRNKEALNKNYLKDLRLICKILNDTSCVCVCVQRYCWRNKVKEKEGDDSIKKNVKNLPSPWRVASKAKGVDPRPPRPRLRRDCKRCLDHRRKTDPVLIGSRISSLKLRRY